VCVCVVCVCVVCVWVCVCVWCVWRVCGVCVVCVCVCVWVCVCVVCVCVVCVCLSVIKKPHAWDGIDPNWNFRPTESKHLFKPRIEATTLIDQMSFGFENTDSIWDREFVSIFHSGHVPSHALVQHSKNSRNERSVWRQEHNMKLTLICPLLGHHNAQILCGCPTRFHAET